VKEIKNEGPEANVKTIDELLREMEIEDSDMSNDAAVIAALRRDFTQVKLHERTWTTKTIEDIRAWSDSKRGTLTRAHLPEALAVLNRANSLITGWKSLRDAQILSVLGIFHTKVNHGAFFEILTGEGKTVIVSLMAVLKILIGEKYIDVITSNSVLAEEGMNDRRSFYAIFDVSVGCNNWKKDYTRDMKKCYKADVCYGTMGNFQGWIFL
jgi:preprotein translocase subunit SecA